MDSFHNNTRPSQSTSRNGSFKDFLLISPVVQIHLKKVYLSLCFSLLASAVGAYLHIIWNGGGLLTTLATLGCMCWLLAIPTHEEKKRVSLLMLSALFQGASVGPFIKLATDFNPSILVCVFVGSAIAFACFSGAAMLASREYLCLGRLLSSCVSVLLWVHFASSILEGSLAFKFQLYFGLVVFVGYMMFDTLDIIKKAHLGDLDYVSHALMLSTDFIAVFVRILIIMTRNSDDRAKWRNTRD
uniref:bax inhibitor 1-like n=1 Tax=Erigeron canadensis TaxID=72917 RepID=UPI001CB9AB13|nr:bax inhibitor 1-like [Erigeron canadensis]